MAKEEPNKRKLTEEEINDRLETYVNYAYVKVTPHVTTSERGIELKIEEFGRPFGGDEIELKRLRYATAGFNPVMMRFLLDLLQQINQDTMQNAFDYVLKCIKLSPNYNGDIPQIYYLGKPISSGQAIVNSSRIYQFAIDELSQRLERLGIPHAIDLSFSPSEKNDREPESQAEIQPESQAEIQPESQPECQPESQPESQPKSQPESQPESQFESQPESQKTFTFSKKERVKKIHAYLVETGVIEPCDYEDFFVWVKNAHFPADNIQVKKKLKFYYAMGQISSLIIDEVKDWKKSVLTSGQWDTLYSNNTKIEARWKRNFP